MSKNVVTLDSIVHAKFVTIRSICESDKPGKYAVHLQPTNDHDVDICVQVSRDRATALGFAPSA